MAMLPYLNRKTSHFRPLSTQYKANGMQKIDDDTLKTGATPTEICQEIGIDRQDCSISTNSDGTRVTDTSGSVRKGTDASPRQSPSYNPFRHRQRLSPIYPQARNQTGVTDDSRKKKVSVLDSHNARTFFLRVLVITSEPHALGGNERGGSCYRSNDKNADYRGQQTEKNAHLFC